MKTVSAFIKKRFSRSAETYDQYSRIQQDVASYLIEITQLPDTEAPILEIGAGTGILTSHLKKYYCKDQILCVDISHDMLKKIRVKGISDNCIQADFHALPFRQDFSFVLSSTSLHWANDIPSIIEILHSTLRSGGMFSFSIMLQNTYHLLRKVKEGMGITTHGTLLPDYQEFCSALTASGFSIEYSEVKNFNETFSSIHEVFMSIRYLGVSGLSRNPLPRGILRTLKNRYLAASIEKYSKPCLEYEAGFFTGRKL
jgi:malonyl-CoA O-methyltransferase